MQNKVVDYIKDKDATIDFSGVNNLDQQTKEKFEDSIKNIREQISKTSDPSETSTKVSSLVEKIFNTGDITKKQLGSEAKKLKLKKDLKDELSNLHDTIENFKQPDIDLRTTAAGASGKEICRVLQGFLGIAEDRNWRTLGRKNKFKMAFGKSPDGIEFSLEYAIVPRGKNNQIAYDNDSPVGTSYNNDIFPELKKPIEQNQLEMLLKNSIDNPNIAADLSELHDKGKNDIQSAIVDVQDELKRGDIDPKLRQKIKTFAKQLIDKETLGIPSGVDDVPGLRDKLEKLKSEIKKFKEPRPEEQKRIAEFVLNTLENDAAHQPSFEDVPGLKENPRLQRATADFMLITNIAEAAAPTKALLKVMKDQGITDLSKGNLDKLNKEGKLDEKWSATGRTLGLDSVMRDKLRSFIEGKTDKQDLDKLFSADENGYPARDKTEKGREYGGSHQDQPLSPGPTSPGMDFLSNSDDDLMEVDDTKGVIASGLTNTENLAETTRKRARDVDDDGEIASKQAKVDSDAEYMQNLADETLDESLDCDTKRNNLHKKRHHWYRKKQQLSHKREGICSVKNKDKLVLDEDSIQLKGNKLEFEFYEPHNKDVKYKVSTDVDQKRLSSLKYIAEKEKYTEHTGEETGLRGKIGTAFGVHGLVMSVFGAINAFEQGNTVSGAITVAQTIHSLSSFETVKKFTDFAANIAKKALQKAVVFGAEKLGLSEVAEKAASKLARLAESDAGLLLGDIPFVGLAFDAYFIANDIKDLVNANYSDAGEVALDVVHLALDIGTTVASMLVDALGPEFEPVVWALSLIRMSIDDFYIDISTELKKAHGVGGKILAVFKGIAEGFVDFLTGGLLRGLQQLNERQRHDQDLLRNLSNPQSYYKLEGTDCKGAAGTIDFTAGAFSGQGGDISFKLNDDDSFTVTLTGVPAEGGEKQTISRKFQCPGLRDIVLGVGETQDAVWTKQKAKLWGVITVKSADVIDHFTANNGSLYGSYTGNKLNNAFYAFQGNLSKVLSDECKDPEATGTIDFRIRNYFYLLNGLAGNDTFLLGPQSAHVTGGTGHDLYYLGTHGGNTVIDNFAFDKLSDTLWLNVSHVHVVCGRKGFDLLITYCGTHMVQIKEWFFPVQNQFRQHLILLTRDGIQLKVKDFGVKDDNYQVACVPVSIDRSKSTTAQHLNLTEEQYREVVTVTGSKVSDVIIGNDKDNYINAGPGANQITGGEGADTYLLRPIGQKSKVKRQQTREYCDYINNFAKDVAQDKIFLPIDYDDIILTASTQQEVPEIRKAPRKLNSRERPRENGRGQSDGNENELTDMTEMEERPQDMDEEMQPPHLDLRISNESRRNLREGKSFFAVFILITSSSAMFSGYIPDESK